MELDLRVILLCTGVVLIVAIVLDGIRRKRHIQRQLEQFDETVISNTNAQSEFFVDDDPLLSNDLPTSSASTDSAPSFEGSFETPDETSFEPTEPPKPQKRVATQEELICVSLIAPAGQAFAGRSVANALAQSGLKFGEKRIYHKHEQDRIENPALFSLTSMTEPGYFEVNKMVTSKFKGLMLFMVVTEVSDPLKTYNLMLHTAGDMAEALGARVCDARRNLLTAQTVEHQKEQIKEYQRQQLMSKKS